MRDLAAYMLSGGLAVLLLCCCAGAGIYHTSERFGASYDYSAIEKPISYYDYSNLGHLGWYMDGESDYAGCAGPVVQADGWGIGRVIVAGKESAEPARDAARKLYLKRPGWFEGGKPNYWMIGSRLGIDCYTYQPGRCNQAAWQVDDYVRNFHDWSGQIQSVDLKGKMVSGSAVLGLSADDSYDNTDFLKESMRRYYSAYHTYMPIDIFSLQIIVTNASGSSLEEVKSAIRGFREWMGSVELANGIFHSYAGSELWLSCYGIEDADISQVVAIERMEEITRWLMGSGDSDIFDSSAGLPGDDNRLVQRWAWNPLASRSREFQSSSLFGRAGDITEMGKAYAELYAHTAPEPGSIGILVLGFWLWFGRRFRH